ncbi:MAG: SLBB domain-containing protein [Christensenella hongkongensis]|uniref:4Fe-4S dicluster domain-containing protein n=1 Tax=Christensenella hongkongensis TaxID=270498 RepID=UPI002670DB2C|nr:4Fe-4S dicluster domain-containing protein [Christensenella hongkongensis]MDY3005266.1 SLBB domain-containing protein [Christensenella hongkongensis]
MDIAGKIREAGIVGAGGAGFPTHVKVNCKAEYVIANGAECEPLLRVDQQVMQYYADGVVEGLLAVMEQTGAKKGVIALKDHYKDAIAALEKAIQGADDVELHIMNSYYPAGDEQQIVYEVTGRVVPTGGLPLDVGAVVCNVSTLTEIARALEGKTVTDKFVTVGGAVKNPRTLKVPIGISGLELIEAAGGTTDDCVYVIGGPCMGRMSDTADVPVTKTTGGLLAIPKNHPLVQKKDDCMNVQVIQAVCCQCSMCTQMCPRNALGLNVAPHKAMRAVANGVDLIGNSMNGIFSCCDCGICTYYACNFGLKPSKIMQRFKAQLMNAGVKPKKEVFTTVDTCFDTKKLPVSRIISRLGIEEFDVPAPMQQSRLRTDVVRIPLKMHVGAPAVSVVSEGQQVKRGTMIADIREKALGAKIHASITGTVTKVTDDWIEIRGTKA